MASLFAPVRDVEMQAASALGYRNTISANSLFRRTWMAKSESPEPVGTGDYIVDQGECMASIAYENGFLMDTLWNHPGNSSLKAGRKDPNVLLPGDRVHIPEKRIREESCATDNNHQFLLRGEPEVLRIVLLDSDGNPRKSIPYSIKIKGGQTKTGKTDRNGLIEVPIMPNDREGELTIEGKGMVEHYELELGAIDPPSTVTGIQARLNNLGYFCGEVDVLMGPLMAGALKKFQKSQNLSATGTLDDNTRDVLVKQHGF